MACSPPFRNLGLLDEADRMETDERSHTETHPAVCHLFDYPVCCDHGSHFGREYPKAQAGDRRLLIWNITTQAIMEHPVTGIGIGGFPATYAKEQSAYFETDTASSKEKQTATCPQYAYNEYLQIGLELGITGLLFFIFWLAFSLYYGIRHRQIGASGGILALGIFALYSYPLQLPTYWVLLLFLTAICVTNPKHNKQRAQRSIPYISAIAAILTCILFYGQKDTYYTYREWKTLQELYHNQEYEQAASRYAGLFVQLYHRTDFYMREQNVSIRPDSTILPSNGWTGH